MHTCQNQLKYFNTTCLFEKLVKKVMGYDTGKNKNQEYLSLNILLALFD